MYTVEFWNVGQGDASSIQIAENKYILIDVGPKNSTLSQWLIQQGPITIKDIILTHNDVDHIGALPSILNASNVTVERVLILVDRDIKELLKMNSFKPAIKLYNAGKLEIGRLECSAEPKILWQENELVIILRYPDLMGNIKSKSPNDASAILTLQSGSNVHIMWTGDAPIERVAMVAGNFNPKVLFGPHHGAPIDKQKPSFFNWIESIGAEFCYLSLGSHNGHNHPNPRYVKGLRDSGVCISCSQITKHCSADIVNSGKHVMNTNGYYGLPVPSTGVYCRGHVKLYINEGQLEFDEYHKEHQEKVKSLGKRNAKCQTK